MDTLGRKALDAMVAEATVDCYDEHDELSGLFTMIEEHLALPFTTQVLGVPVTVKAVEHRADGGIVAFCSAGSHPASDRAVGPAAARPATGRCRVDRGVSALGALRR